jgi:deoxyribodipyrimidine photo-lyase
MCDSRRSTRNGLIPLAEHGRAFTAARFYRAFVQRVLVHHVKDVPEEDTLARLRRGPELNSLPRAASTRWPPASDRLLTSCFTALAALPINHAIAPVRQRGGSDAARRLLRTFIKTRLAKYDVARNDPDADGTSRLSPYLHFGHLSAHEVFAAVMTHERWTTRRLAAKGGGRREGWWGVSKPAEASLDQLIVWRELAFNGCEYMKDYASYASLPDWARKTLAAHARDRRTHQYTHEQLENAETHDPIWNAVQRQLVAEGWFHGYLRMLWGKKILEWSSRPAKALDHMRSLMIATLSTVAIPILTPDMPGYDRPWPRRPIFGTVRYMSSASAKRKLKMKNFLEQYAPPA